MATGSMDTKGGENWKVKFGNAWKQSDSRGFYFGPSSNNAWNNEQGWRDSIVRENRIASKFMEEQGGLTTDSLADAKSGKKTKRAGRSLSPMRKSLSSTLNNLSKPDQLRTLSEKIAEKGVIGELIRRQKA